MVSPSSGALLLPLLLPASVGDRGFLLLWLIVLVMEGSSSSWPSASYDRRGDGGVTDGSLKELESSVLRMSESSQVGA